MARSSHLHWHEASISMERSTKEVFSLEISLLAPLTYVPFAAFDQTDRKTLLDDYQYAMYGKVFKYSQEKAPSVKV